MKEITERINSLLSNEEFCIKKRHIYLNNIHKEGIALESKNCNTTPFIYLDNEIWEKPDSEIVEYLKELYQEHSTNIDITLFISSENILKKVRPRVFSKNNISNLEKRHIVYVPYLDMVVTFYITLDQLEYKDNTATFQITDDLLIKANMSITEIYQAAVKNAETDFTVFSMYQVIKNLEEKLSISAELEDELPMLVVSNGTNVFGAGGIICKNILKKLEKDLGSHFAVLPCSIHEFICVPILSNDDLLYFQSMVKEINESCLKPEDKLTDSIYIWEDGELRQFVC